MAKYHERIPHKLFLAYAYINPHWLQVLHAMMAYRIKSSE
jgi:hypothetical protein